ncbi:uncharacterized protein LTHEOB_10467 [Neofusicoccum parvum]|uniref:Uncharacterized protein LTHEOB_10467 n=1 Tax=Neofusicoccum parvum TaxID=310453 RepID=A0ACB5SDV2_9PEZI|nr:uncharacterized protein LTHEOB_10467 [Neofusicoccum parvum]
MATFGLISLDHATATYDPVKHQLRVNVEGSAPHGTHGIQLKPIQIIGGLRYELDAWTPTYPVERRPYHYEQTFDIPSLTVEAPSGEITIVSLNHPCGLPVTVRWLGYKGTPTTKLVVSGNGAHSLKQQDGTQVDGDNITALYKEPFNVKEPIPTSGQGFAKVLFDPYALMMANSSVEHGIITWTLNSLKTGRTQVIVERWAGEGLGLIRKVYNVNVVVLDNVLAQDSSIAQVDCLSGTVESQGKAILDFLGRVFVAVRIIRKAVPEAQLLWVKAKLPRGVIYPVTDPNLLSHLECRFSTPSGSASMTSRGWGDWAPPVFSHHKIIGMHHIDVEKLPMHINGAAEAMRKHHIKDAFWEASLESPSVAPEELPDEPPYYVFHMVDGKHVWVSQTGEICVTEACERVFPKQGL